MKMYPPGNSSSPPHQYACPFRSPPSTLWIRFLTQDAGQVRKEEWEVEKAEAESSEIERIERERDRGGGLSGGGGT